MGKKLDYVQEATGTRACRRIYPAELPPFVPTLERVRNVPQGGRHLMSSAAFRKHQKLNLGFERG